MRTLACLILVFCLSACGQKGPLFLPNEEGDTTEEALPEGETSKEGTENQTETASSAP